MYDAIRKNKIKTGLVISIFILMITLFIFFICYMIGYSEYALFFAFLFSVITTIFTYYNCDKVVLLSVKARKADQAEDRKLNEVLDNLMIASGLEHRPDLYVIDTAQPNAFATGRDPEHSIICVTRGLLEKLDYYELEGVLAHELSHIKNYDIRLQAVISVMAGFIIMISDFAVRFIFRGHRGGRNNRSSSLDIIVLIVGLIFMILSPIFTELIQLAVSRQREYLADATACSFTRNPNGLISALTKISSDDSEFYEASNSTAHMFIVTPFTKKRSVKTNLFSTHPSTADRIEALKKLK